MGGVLWGASAYLELGIGWLNAQNKNACECLGTRHEEVKCAANWAVGTPARRFASAADQ